jgi:hypothetical protein
MTDFSDPPCAIRATAGEFPMTKAKHDRLLAALIAKLPMKTDQWPRADRIAWLQMMAMAFDVVYGPCGGVQVMRAEPQDEDADQTAIASPTGVVPAGTPQRFYVDRDGFAMGDSKPLAMEDLPAGAILWDERIGADCGDVAAILWRDIGTSRRSLPPGVTLRPMSDAS